MGLVPGRSRGTPAGLAVAASLAGLCAVAYRKSLAAEDPAVRARSRSLLDTSLGKPSRGIVRRQRQTDRRKMSRPRRDIAVRCLVRIWRMTRGLGKVRDIEVIAEGSSPRVGSFAQ
jgi:hypothetical protein